MKHQSFAKRESLRFHELQSLMKAEEAYRWLYGRIRELVTSEVADNLDRFFRISIDAIWDDFNRKLGDEKNGN